MSRDIVFVPDQEADLIGTLEKILKELRKMNLYLSYMTDLEVKNEDAEE